MEPGARKTSTERLDLFRDWQAARDAPAENFYGFRTPGTLQMTQSYHRRAVAQHCINGDCLSQWGMPKFDPP